VSALRALFTRAQRSGLIGVNPAAAVPKPLRRPSRRRPLDHPEVEELINGIRTKSSDPDLDLLLVRFHLESGARREGALNLRIRDIDEGRATVWLREKFGAERAQPISPSLVRLLIRHASARGGVAADDAVFRSRQVGPSLDVGTTRSSTGHGRVCRGPTAPLCPRMCSATPRSAPSDASLATRSPRHSQATAHRR
jgi:integrase